jgi:deoxyhypusine synthase
VKREEYLQHPTRPLDLSQVKTVGDLVEAFGGTSFQSRNLHRAMKVWAAALAEPDCAIFLGLSGAMVPAGMRRVVVDLVRARCVDVIVSTGANLYHDLYEGTGGLHYLGHVEVDDEELARHDIDRVYDTYADDKSFQGLDHMIADLAAGLPPRPYSTREFLREAGRVFKLKDSIVGVCYAENVPIFCPTFHDSGWGIGWTRMYHLTEAAGRPHATLDLIKDNREIAALRLAAKESAGIYIGGGVPKNYTQQIEPLIEVMTDEKGPGHRYAIQITTDAPHWGGLSGCTFEEAKSWDKLVDGFYGAQVFLEASVGFPLLAKAVLERYGAQASGRRRDFVEAVQAGARG